MTSHIYIGRALKIISVFAVLGGLLLMSAAPAGAFTDNYSRSISMSSSKPSATAVTYHVQFTADSSYSLRTLIVDFCSNSPLAGQNCTAPTGFTVGGSPTVANLLVNGATPGGTWTPSSQNSGRTFVYSGSVSAAVSAGNVVSFDITSVTNQSTVGSFFGRIFTYTTASPSYSDTSTDVFAETGSVALSTATAVGFIFQVPENLQFCVYKTVCGDAPVVVLGHGPGAAINSGQIDTDTAKFSITTNAVEGVIVRAFGTPPKIPSHTLAAINGGNGLQAPMTAGTEAFGFKVSPTSGAIAATTDYADTGGDDYTFDTTAMVPPSTSGAALTQQAAPGPVNNAIFTITFGATASNVTPAGTYTTNMSLVATGTF